MVNVRQTKVESLPSALCTMIPYKRYCKTLCMKDHRMKEMKDYAYLSFPIFTIFFHHS